MAVIVMIYGKSGSGKSTSLRNFKQGDVTVINVSRKPMPFRAQFTDIIPTDDYTAIRNAVKDSVTPSVVIDDATYLMVDEFMRNRAVSGYQKFTVLGGNFFDLITMCRDSLPDNKIIYFMGHVEQNESGDEHFKTIGKLLDEKVTLEGLFTVVLKTVVQDKRYCFQTQTNGHDTVKSPMGLFDTQYIDNDLAAVDAAIREYWNIPAEKMPVKNNTPRFAARR